MFSKTQLITEYSLINSILGTGLFKFMSIVVSIITVPIVLSNLGQEVYGIWLTMSSVFNWIMYFDIGLGSGLRNKFAEAMALGEIKKAKHYVSTAYVFIGLVALGFLMVFFFLNPFLDWGLIFNSQAVSRDLFSLVVVVIFPMFCLQFFLGLIKSMLIGHKKSVANEFITFATGAGILFLIIILSFNVKLNLFHIALVYSGVPILLLVIASIYFFSKEYRSVIPSISFYKKEHLNDIGSLGLKFFAIQICSLVTVASSNIIITNLFSPEEVVPFNLVHRYYFFVFTGFSIVNNPLYGLFPKAFVIKDLEYIKNVIRKISNLAYVASVIIFLMMIFYSPIFQLWIGDSVYIPFSLVLLMGLYFIITIMMTAYATFVSAVGAIQISFYFSIFNATMHIPLTMIYSLYFGPVGIVLAMLTLILPGIYWLPKQTRLLIEGKAKGVWRVV